MKYGHADRRKYFCDDCDLKFKQKKSLRDHNLNVHGINQFKEKYHNPEETKIFECSHCTRSYKRKKDLNHHIRNVHESMGGDLNFSGDVCKSSFKQKKILKFHVKQKHGQGESLCPKCGKLFDRKDIMKKHLYRHNFD